ncbi:MAG: hypothetical protein COB22_01575 [Cycloclasticus sp.]|nr:MAG: hypothetical protein COB22_01575 [Cycloclasticus sp.]
MKIFKGLLFITILTALLVGCSEDSATSNSDKVFKIDGAFGLKLGDQGPGLPNGYLADNKPFYFKPDTVHEYFNSYTFSVTPNTHAIYGVKMLSPKELPKAICKDQRKEIIKEILASLGDTSNLRITENGNLWKIREENKRSITVDCELALSTTTRQLVMTVSDTALSKLSYVEWAKHQDDITTSQ